MTPTFDCICAGIVVADHVCEPIDHVPAAGELVLTPRMDLTVGGCAANVAVDLARLGCRVALAAAVGRDMFGRFVRETVAAAGVDCTHLTESTTRDTSGTLIINARGQDRRFIHSAGANADFTGTEMTPDLIRSGRVLYLGGYLLCEEHSAERVAAAFRQARELGIPTVLDVVVPRPEECRSRLEPVLPWTDVFLPNDDEARLITGLDDPLAQAEEFRRMGARTVVVTRGGKGAVLVGERERLRAAAYPVEFVDGTGSGDAFDAGYIYGMLHGRDTRDCLRYGSALGASCVRAIGATTGVFTTDELREYVAAHPLAIETLA